MTPSVQYRAVQLSSWRHRNVIAGRNRSIARLRRSCSRSSSSARLRSSMFWMATNKIVGRRPGRGPRPRPGRIPRPIYRHAPDPVFRTVSWRLALEESREGGVASRPVIGVNRRLPIRQARASSTRRVTDHLVPSLVSREFARGQVYTMAGRVGLIRRANSQLLGPHQVLGVHSSAGRRSITLESSSRKLLAQVGWRLKFCARAASALRSRKAELLDKYRRWCFDN